MQPNHLLQCIYVMTFKEYIQLDVNQSQSLRTNHRGPFSCHQMSLLGPPVVTRKLILARHVEGHLISRNAHRGPSVEEALWRSYNRGDTDGSSTVLHGSSVDVFPATEMFQRVVTHGRTDLSQSQPIYFRPMGPYFGKIMY